MSLILHKLFLMSLVLKVHVKSTRNLMLFESSDSCIYCIALVPVLIIILLNQNYLFDSLMLSIDFSSVV